jgi:hypothetical protein
MRIRYHVINFVCSRKASRPCRVNTLRSHMQINFINIPPKLCILAVSEWESLPNGKKAVRAVFFISLFPSVLLLSRSFSIRVRRQRFFFFFFAVFVLMENLYMNNAVSAEEINYKFNETGGDKWSFDGSVAPSKL